jgi:hypothetical protein
VRILHLNTVSVPAFIHLAVTMLRRCKHAKLQALEGSLSSALSLCARAFAAVPAFVPPAEGLPAFEYTPPPYTGPSRADVIKLRKEFLSPGVPRILQSLTGEVYGSLNGDSCSALNSKRMRSGRHLSSLQVTSDDRGR